MVTRYFREAENVNKGINCALLPYTNLQENITIKQIQGEMLSLLRVSVFPLSRGTLPLASTAQFSSSAKVLLKTSEGKKKVATKKPESGATKEKKGKKKPGVKKAVPAYFFYVKERYATGKESIMAHEFAKRNEILRDEWSKLNAAERAPFESAAKTDKERYTAEVEQAKKDAPPKRPLSGYFRWFQENREALLNANPGIATKDLVKLAGAEWRKLSTDIQESFNGEARRDMDVWKQDYAKWKEAKNSI